jgi:polyhydroxyalkanoate synthesis regulator phasin
MATGGSPAVTDDYSAVSRDFRSDFIVDIKKVLDRIHTTLKTANEQGKKVTQELIREIRAISAGVVSKCAAEEKRSDILRAELNVYERLTGNLNEKHSELVQGINRLASIVEERTPQYSLPQEVAGKVEEDQVLIIDTKDDNGAKTYCDILRANKEEFKGDKIRDIIIPKSNRLLIKMKNRTELENVLVKINDIDNLKDKAVTRINKLRKYRMICFGLNKETTEEEFKLVVEGLPELVNREIDIIRSFVDRRGATNIIFDTDSQTNQILLKLGRVAIDFNRCRFDNFIPVKRCFRCQKFGHISPNCSEPEVCGGCGGAHDTRGCNVATPHCVNCERETEHRSDSKTCPAFVQYRSSLFNRA